MRAAIVLLFALLLATSAGAALRPWQWTPARAGSYLMQTKPSIEPDPLTTATCRGTGKRIQGRYIAFRCATSFQTSGRKTLYAKVRQVTKPMLCVNTKPAIPSGCLAKNGASRALGTAALAYSAARKPGQAYVSIGCTGYGAGFYICAWTQTDGVAGTTQIIFTTRGIVKR